MDVLISGASMAGLTAAHWFSRLGADVTVVERADGLRRGGAPIDVRGEALGTADRMGLLDAVRDSKVVDPGPADVLGADGQVEAAIDLTWFANETDDDIEITRDRLNDLLLTRTEGCEFRFNDTIVELDDDDDGVEVTFLDGSRQRFDLVVGADGLHSTIRALKFGPEENYLRHMGFYAGPRRERVSAGQDEFEDGVGVAGVMS